MTVWYKTDGDWIDTGFNLATVGPVRSIVDNGDGTVTITLSDEDDTSYTFQKAVRLKIGDGATNDAILVESTASATVIDLMLPTDFAEEDYSALLAQVVGGPGTAVATTRAASDPWQVSVTPPTFTEGLYETGSATVSVTPPAGIDQGELAMLEVTIVGADGTKTTAARALRIDFSGATAYDAAGEGTTQSPYRIYTPVQLADLAAAVNSGIDMSGIRFKQMADLDLGGYAGGKGWTPIGFNLENSFRGIYDGGGHTLANLFIFRPDEDHVALFGYVGTGGSLTGIGIVSGSIEGQNQVGNVCGTNNGTLTAYYNRVSVSGTDNVGGVCGTTNGGTLTACYNTGEVSADSNFGGVCGTNNGGTLTACYFLDYGTDSGVGTGDGSGATAFGPDAWPEITDPAWNTTTDGTGGYWKELSSGAPLGGWVDGGTPAGADSTFPRLWGE